MTWTSWVSLVLGVWLVLAPFALGYVGTFGAWNDAIVGLVITIVAGWAAFIRTPRVVTLSSITGAAGLWAALAPFFFTHGPVGTRGWNALVVGLLVLVLSTARALDAGVRRHA